MDGHYVVTGGAGFIGSAIVRSLLREGARSVVVIDNLLSGRESNLEEIRRSVDFERADICEYEQIAPLIRGAAVVFHEAAIPSVTRSIVDPLPSHEVNINGTFNVLRAAQEGKAGRIVYAASSSAYGDTEALPKVETMTPRPKSPYALQKLVGEYYANVFSSVFGVEAVALRYFNVYGPRQDPLQPVFWRAVAVHEGDFGAAFSHDLRRRRAVAGLYLCRRCRGSEPEGRSGTEHFRQALQCGQRQPHHH